MTDAPRLNQPATNYREMYESACSWFQWSLLSNLVLVICLVFVVTMWAARPKAPPLVVDMPCSDGYQPEPAPRG